MIYVLYSKHISLKKKRKKTYDKLGPIAKPNNNKKTPWGRDNTGNETTELTKVWVAIGVYWNSHFQTVLVLRLGSKLLIL